MCHVMSSGWKLFGWNVIEKRFSLSTHVKAIAAEMVNSQNWLFLIKSNWNICKALETDVMPTGRLIDREKTKQMHNPIATKYKIQGNIAPTLASYETAVCRLLWNVDVSSFAICYLSVSNSEWKTIKKRRERELLVVSNKWAAPNFVWNTVKWLENVMKYLGVIQLKFRSLEIYGIYQRAVVLPTRAFFPQSNLRDKICQR